MREQINGMLRDNRTIKVIKEWLLEQTSTVALPELGIAVGDRWEKIWKTNPSINCHNALRTYRHGKAYREWLIEDKRDGVVGGIIANLDALATVGGESKAPTEGLSRVALSAVLERLEKVTHMEGGAPLGELIQLTKAVATLNSGMVASRKADIDVRKLKLLEKKAAESAKKPKMTPEEKQQRMKEIFGIQ
jgi:hypothetical protein